VFRTRLKSIAYFLGVLIVLLSPFLLVGLPDTKEMSDEQRSHLCTLDGLLTRLAKHEDKADDVARFQAMTAAVTVVDPNFAKNLIARLDTASSLAGLLFWQTDDFEYEIERYSKLGYLDIRNPSRLARLAEDNYERFPNGGALCP